CKMSGAADRLKVVVNHLDRPSSFVRLSHCHSLAVSRYSFDNDLLSTEQRISYEEDGFLLIKGLVSGEDIDRFRAAFERIFRREVQVPGLVVMRDMSIAKSEFIPDQKAIPKLLPQVHTLHGHTPTHADLFHWSNIMAMHTMLINKPPDTGNRTSRHSMHQDLHYFPFCPADRIVWSWTAVEKVHSLVVLPGSHHGTLKEHDHPEWKAISCHYAGANCYYVDVRGTTQENIGQEVYEITASKYAVDDATFKVHHISAGVTQYTSNTLLINCV
uniref:phytanoyl-CoA dioxygenase n=1 Tax=Oncorhynchus mykiss TaxID=8022 RepID=A0A8C7TG85_ONCMY